MNVKIISDSTCDLSGELISKYDIEIVPLHVHLGESEFIDGVTITPDEIYAWSDENNAVPRTSAPSIASTVKTFKKYITEGRDIVCFSISSQMSGTGNIMCLAARELGAEDKVHVIDSQNLSTGIALTVIEAAVMALDGKSAVEITNHVQNIIPKVRASFVIDTLTYLHRGGRCSGIAALAGSTLKLHPKITVNSGKMVPSKKYMGSMQKALASYIRDLEADLLAAEPDRVFITHSGCSENLIHDAYSYLEGLSKFKEILVTRAGCVVSSHCGPNTIGVLFIDRRQ